MRIEAWAAALALALVGCGGSEEHEEGPNCAAITEACHEPGEAGDAEAEECHELAHHADEDACAAERDRCVEYCEGFDTGM